MIITARPLLLIEPDEDLLADALLEETLAFFLGSVAPDDAIRLEQRNALVDPRADFGVGSESLRLRRVHTGNLVAGGRFHRGRIRLVHESQSFLAIALRSRGLHSLWRS